MTEHTNESDERAMKNVSHTNPNTGETFGYVYRRGPAVADGGRTAPATDAGVDAAPDAAERTAMKDIDHTPPHGESANDVWVRGGSRRGEDVDE